MERTGRRTLVSSFSYSLLQPYILSINYKNFLCCVFPSHSSHRTLISFASFLCKETQRVQRGIGELKCAPHFAEMVRGTQDARSPERSLQMWYTVQSSRDKEYKWGCNLLGMKQTIIRSIIPKLCVNWSDWESLEEVQAHCLIQNTHPLFEPWSNNTPHSLLANFITFFILFMERLQIGKKKSNSTKRNAQFCTPLEEVACCRAMCCLSAFYKEAEKRQAANLECDEKPLGWNWISRRGDTCNLRAMRRVLPKMTREVSQT